MKANVKVGVWSGYDYCPVNHPRLSGVKQRPVICSWILWVKNSDGVSRAGLSRQHMELQLHRLPQCWGRLTQMVGVIVPWSLCRSRIRLLGWDHSRTGLRAQPKDWTENHLVWPWVVWASHSRPARF